MIRSRSRSAAATPADPLATPLSSLRGVGPRRAADLARAGLGTVADLLCRFPLRYEDRRGARPIASVTAGEVVTVVGRVLRAAMRPTRRPGFTVFELLVGDDSGRLPVVWFNQRFLRDVLVAGQVVALYGKVETRGLSGLQMTSPQYEIVAGADDVASGRPTPTLHSGRVVPVYERVGTLTPKVQRTLVAAALETLPAGEDDLLPAGLLARLGLPARRRAFADTHFPPESADLEALNAFRAPCQRRLVFEEFFLFQLGLALRRRANGRVRKAHAVTVDDRVRDAARAVLPFRLTEGQRRALAEIVADLQGPAPMNRLLQGDVGSGKTIVALLAALVVLENGLQVAFMAPTEILAEQHAASLARLLARSRFGVALLTGSTSRAARRQLGAGLAAGDIPFVVGTHALVQEGVVFSRLGLAIVDEQHRFGVAQRATLRDKGLCPDVLVMTATPIPRTLALTTYGDLDVSTIRDQPPGRTPIRTTARPESRRDEVYAFMRSEIDRGRQAYVVYPLIEESEKVDVRAATAMADHLAADVFPAYRLALLHGRLPPEAKDRVMRAFAAGEVDVLVSTTVIEVGVDVPNATVMVVEHAERFGLAQLHQLRGRVGRGAHVSSCVLLYQAPLSDEARARLEVLTETTDGFRIAERDLELRGPGEVFGTRQAGMPRLRVGDLVRDRELMELARREATAWLELAPAAARLVDEARTAWTSRFGLVGVG